MKIRKELQDMYWKLVRRPRSVCARSPWLSTILASLTLVLIMTHLAVAQDQKRERRPSRVQVDQTAPRQVDMGPAGPRLNSSDELRRVKESKMRSQNRNIERKLIRLIKNTPDSNPKKPLFLDRLATLYWKLASESQNQAYKQEEDCVDRSDKSDAAVDRCGEQRASALQSAEETREKAIQVYQIIAMNFPQFEELDRIYFALGFNFQQKQQNEDAKKLYTTLIQEYPESRMLPDAVFNLADIFFATGDIDNASSLYQHVIDNFRKHAVYPYAVYKLGWCRYNKTDFQGALKQFVEVIKLQNKSSKSRLSLKKEAQRDLVRVYINVTGASATGGLKLLRKYAPKRFDELAERLADLYSGSGQFKKSNLVLRKLIKRNPKSYSVVGYQIRISENLTNTHSPKDTIESLQRLVALWRSVKNAPDAKPRRVKDDRKRIERQLNALARQYHNQALETKSAEDSSVALELYRTYVDSFPNDPNTYEMSFYYGELLYRLGKWAEAADNYERVLKINNEGEFTADAAHGFYLCYKNLLKSDLDSSSINDLDQSNKSNKIDSKRRGKKGKKGKKGKSAQEPAQPQYPQREISANYKKLLSASQLYRQYVKEGKYLTDIQYEEARVYYVFNHFERAIPLFKAISEGVPDHRLAVFSANLLLECFNRKGDFDNLAKQVRAFIPIYTPQRDAKFANRLQKLVRELDFQRCSLMEKRGEDYQAARCFERYGDQFAESELMDQAFANAGVLYEREQMIKKAFDVRTKILNNDESPLRSEIMYLIAQNLQALAIYEQAANIYELFAKEYPKDKNATESLRRAAQFRLGLGQNNEATDDLKKYIKRLRKQDQDKAILAYFELGHVYKKRKQWSKLIKHYKSLMRKFKRVDVGYVIRAYTIIGNAYESKSNIKLAQAAYKQASKTYAKIPKAKRKDLDSQVRYAMAEAAFKQVSYEFKQMRKIDFTKVPRTRNFKRHMKEVSKKITRLAGKIDSLKTKYGEILDLNVERWGLAALAQVGQMYEFSFTTLENTPPPLIFDYELQAEFRANMFQFASTYRQLAVQSYEICLNKARLIRWFNKWTDFAEKKLAQINPENFNYSIEERARPVNFHQPTIKRGLITELPSEEE